MHVFHWHTVRLSVLWLLVLCMHAALHVCNRMFSVWLTVDTSNCPYVNRWLNETGQRNPFPRWSAAIYMKFKCLALKETHCRASGWHLAKLKNLDIRNKFNQKKDSQATRFQRLRQTRKQQHKTKKRRPKKRQKGTDKGQKGLMGSKCWVINYYYVAVL